MTRGDTRQIAALVAAVLSLALLASCGDSDSTTSSTETSLSANGGDAADAGGDKSKSQGSTADDATQKAGGSGDESVSTPLQVSGGGSEQFRFKGGDNSIQEYGEEGDESELQEAAEAVHGFYVARAEEDWSKACSYLAESMVSQLGALVEQSSEPKGCASILKGLTRPLPASVRRETTVVNAGSFRHDDERGFLIYYDAEDKPYAIPLEDEDGAWKLTLLSATPLG